MFHNDHNPTVKEGAAMNETINKVVNDNRHDWITRSYSNTLKAAGEGCFIWEESRPERSGIYYIRSTLPSYFAPATCAVLDGVFNRNNHNDHIVVALTISESPAILVIDRVSGCVVEENLFVKGYE